MLNYLCPPALLYAVIMFIYLILELFNEKYHQAFVKAIVGIVFTCILQAFCQMNLGIISWIFVMIPIVFYTYLTLLTFFVFGLKTDKKIINQSTPIPSPSPTPTPNVKKPEKMDDKWSPSNHVSSTPITTSLYTPSIVPFSAYAPKEDTTKKNTDSTTTSSVPTNSASSNSGSDFSYSHPTPTSAKSSNKLLPVTVCTRQTTSKMCNSLSVCAWTGKECINTSAFDSYINVLDASCSSLTDASCGYLDKCYLLSVSENKSKCLPSIPSIGGLLNKSDCKTLLNQMNFDSSTNTTLSTSIDNKGCSSIANRIYSLLV
jgi:hypothetical protein